MSNHKVDPTKAISVRLPESVLAELDEEAKAKGMSRSRIIQERIEHYQNPFTPEFMVGLQDFANQKYEELKDSQPQEAKKIKNGVDFIWNYLN